MGDKDGQMELEINTEQLASKQRLQSKSLPKDQQTVSSADDIQLPKSQQQQTDIGLQSQSNKVITDVLYPETNFNATDTQPNTEEHELETRLK